jgi:phosphoglycerate kinase
LFNKKTIKDIDLTGKRVLLRADYNVPVQNGAITDDYRVKQSLPTIEYILGQPGTSLVIVAHLGRPKGQSSPQFSLAPLAKHLTQLLGKEVQFATDCIGEAVKKPAGQLQAGQILLLENVRFHGEEEKNDPNFAKAIVEASGAQVFVQDGFGVVHRAHATTSAIAQFLPSVAGLLLEKEVTTISQVIQKPEHPLVAVIGGAKISDKIGILNKLIEISDYVAVGGAMANDFIEAEGLNVGKSLADVATLGLSTQILEKAKTIQSQRPFNFFVPIDVVVSTKIDGTAPIRIVDIASHSIADIQAYPNKPEPAAYSVASGEMILDIGPVSAALVAGAIKMAKTVIWNGTVGVTETAGLAGAAKPFAHGTERIVEAIIGSSNKDKGKPFSLVGGGDTAGYVETEGIIDDFSHVSTGGGATLDLIAGQKLSGVEVLLDAQTASPAA